MTLLPEVRPETQRPGRLAPDERPVLSNALDHLAMPAVPARATQAEHPRRRTTR